MPPNHENIINYIDPAKLYTRYPDKGEKSTQNNSCIQKMPDVESSVTVVEDFSMRNLFVPIYSLDDCGTHL